MYPQQPRRMFRIRSIFQHLLGTVSLGMASVLIMPLLASAQLPPGSVLVTDPDLRSPARKVLFRVDPTTGARTILSDFGKNVHSINTVAHMSVAVEGAGTILVVDPFAGSNGLGALFRVDQTTGKPTLLSDLGNQAQGSVGKSPTSVAVEATGAILVLDTESGIASGKLFRVHQTTGERTVLSDIEDPLQGPIDIRPSGLAVEETGTILVGGEFGSLLRVNPKTGRRRELSDFGSFVHLDDIAVEEAGTILVLTSGIALAPRLFRVDQTTGARTVLSNFYDAAQGPTGSNPQGVTVAESGVILVTDKTAGKLFQIDPTTGARTVLSDFGKPGEPGVVIGHPVSGAVEATGTILVLDQEAVLFDIPGVLFRIDPTTGARTVLSDFGKRAQGRRGRDPMGVTVASDGFILVVDPEAGASFRGVLFRVDPTTGARTVLSDFGKRAQGPLGMNPKGIAVARDGSILVVDPDVGRDRRGVLFRVDPTTGARTILSNFGRQAQGTVAETLSGGVAVEDIGTILVVGKAYRTYPGFPSGLSDVLFQLDPTTGARTILSDFGIDVEPNGQGSTADTLVGVTVAETGAILVVDMGLEFNFDDRGALFRVNPTTGVRRKLSNFGAEAQGPRGRDPIGVAVEKTGAILVTDQEAGLDGRGKLFRVDPTTRVRTELSDFGVEAQGPRGRDPYGVAIVP
jgi:glucose/arabinose dehydrogenase